MAESPGLIDSSSFSVKDFLIKKELRVFCNYLQRLVTKRRPVPATPFSLEEKDYPLFVQRVIRSPLFGKLFEFSDGTVYIDDYKGGYYMIDWSGKLWYADTFPGQPFSTRFSTPSACMTAHFEKHLKHLVDRLRLSVRALPDVPIMKHSSTGICLPPVIRQGFHALCQYDTVILFDDGSMQGFTTDGAFTFFVNVLERTIYFNDEFIGLKCYKLHEIWREGVDPTIRKGLSDVLRQAQDFRRCFP